MLKSINIIFATITIISTIIVAIGLIIVNNIGLRKYEQTKTKSNLQVVDHYFGELTLGLDRLNKSHAFWSDGNSYLNEHNNEELSSNLTQYLYDGDFDVDYVFISTEDELFTQEYGNSNINIKHTNIYNEVLTNNNGSRSFVWLEKELFLLTGYPIANDDETDKNGVLILGTLFDENNYNELKLILGNDEVVDLFYSSSSDHDFDSDIDGSEYLFEYSIESLDDEVHLTAFLDFEYAGYIKQTTILTTIILLTISNIIIFTGVRISSKYIEGQIDQTISQFEGFRESETFNPLEIVKNAKMNKIINAFNKIGKKNVSQLVKIRQKNLEIVDMLSRANEINDKYTRNHSDSVSKIAVLLGNKLEVEEINTLERAAQLHDVGKVFLPLKLLNKPGKYTKLEYKSIQEHSVLGSNILTGITDFEEIQSAVRSHHEKYDGTGYPDGLKGKEIPYFARIISIADVYDALTSDRPYRKGFSKEESLEIMKKLSDSHFDPEILNAFFEIIENL